MKEKTKVKNLKCGDSFEYEGCLYHVYDTFKFNGKIETIGSVIDQPAFDGEMEVILLTDRSVDVGDKVKILSFGHRSNTHIQSDGMDINRVMSAKIDINSSESVKVSLEVMTPCINLYGDVSEVKYIDPRMSLLKEALEKHDDNSDLSHAIRRLLMSTNG